MNIKRAAGVTAGWLLTLFVSLAPPHPAEAALVTGRVLDPAGKPVANAEVMVIEFASFATTSVKTDAAGQYTVDLVASRQNVSGATAMLMAIAPGYAPNGIYLAQNATRDIRLRQASTLSGMVQDVNGKPVADAMVRLHYVFWPNGGDANGENGTVYITDALKSRFLVKTGTDGRWTLDYVPTSGTASVMLDTPHYAKVSATLELGATAGKTATLVARPAAYIEGRVVYEDGKPAAGIRLMSQNENRTGTEMWSEVVSAADGSFRLDGLPAGSFQIITTDPTEKSVSAALTGIRTSEGSTTRAADIVMTEGALVQGLVAEERTGAPLPGATIGSYGPHRPRNYGSIASAVSGEDGRYTLRVAPGKSSVYVAGIPKGYVNPNSTAATQIDVELARGETRTVDFKLRQGVTVAGTMLDEAGKPVADVSLTLVRRRVDEEPWLSPIQVKSDQTGKWTAEGLQAGTWLLKSGGDWDILEPKTLQLPGAGDVRIRVKKAAVARVEGRVVEPGGAPIAGADIKLTVTRPRSNTEDDYLFGMSSGAPTTTTNQNGSFVFPDIRRDSTVTLLVRKPGYIYVSGGKPALRDDVFKSNDVILAPLTSAIEGLVTDVAGKPVAGVRVFSPNGGPDALATTDETGKFSLKALPAGTVTLVAAQGNEATTVRAKTGEFATLILRPRIVLPGRNVGRAQEILTRAKVESVGQDPNMGIGTRLARMLAPYAPDTALQLGTDFYGNLSESVVAAVIARLAETNPTRAALWAPEKIIAMQERPHQLSAVLALAPAVVEVDPDLALSLYRHARKLIAERPATDDAALSAHELHLWKTAHRLKLPEAAEHRKAVVAAAEKQTAGYQLANTARSVVEMDPELAEQLVNRIDPHKEPHTFQGIMLPLARANMPLALQLLEQLDKLPKKPERQDPFDAAAQGVVAELAKTDPAAALALAKRVREPYARSVALVRAARYLPKEVAIATLQEALAIAPEHPESSPARIAALLYELDPPTGLKAFTDAKTKWSQWNRAANVAQWAFYYSRIDPAESRFMLEREFARDFEEVAQTGSSHNLLQYAGAMAAVDLDRALEMLAAIPLDTKDVRSSFWLRTNRLERMARYVLAPASRRHTMRLEATGYSEFDEEE